jgi:hypothetical protein
MTDELQFELLPAVIDAFIGKHHYGGVTEQDCRQCSSACCSQGAFALLENVLQIYQRYLNNQLHRTDYSFEPDLAFHQFVGKYFDLYLQITGKWWWKQSVLLFYMKSLSSDNNLISIPPVSNFYNTRTTLFNANPWLNKGCVFLSKKAPNWPENDGDSSRYCILHEERSRSHMTCKPIDCIFYTCVKPLSPKIPKSTESKRWFRLLSNTYPNSLERYRTLIKEDKK